MNLNDSRLGKAFVVEVTGRLDSSTTSTFEAHCNKLIDKGATVFVLDFDKLDYLNSGALRSIILMLKKVKPKGGNVIICGAKGTAKEIFEVSGFSEMFPMTDTIEQAASKVL